MGVATLIAVVVEAYTAFRRKPDASFHLIAAGLLVIAFFATLPTFPISGVLVSGLLTITGFLLVSNTSTNTSHETEELFESSVTRRRR